MTNTKAKQIDHSMWLGRMAALSDAALIERLSLAYDWSTRATMPAAEFHYLEQERGNRHLPAFTGRCKVAR